MIKKPRGRPKSPATIERERIEDLFRNKPPHLIRNDGFTPSIDLDHSKQIEDDLIADYPRTIPHDLIFAANSHYEDPVDEMRAQSELS
jgi:hypothetical protein